MSKIRTWQWAVLGALLAAAIWFVAGRRSSGPVRIGEEAPNFTVPNLKSGNLDLRDFRGKVVVLNFWATWCPPCVDETPSLEAFARQLKDKGVVVLGVSVDEQQAALVKFVANYHLTYPIGRDPSRALAARYGTFKFPETYIIDRTGHVAEKIIGETNWSDPRMITFVEALADGGKSPGRTMMTSAAPLSNYR